MDRASQVPRDYQKNLRQARTYKMAEAAAHGNNGPIFDEELTTARGYPNLVFLISGIRRKTKRKDFWKIDFFSMNDSLIQT